MVENRESGKDIPPDEFFAEFGDRVTGIGCILAMMAPWDNPTYLVSQELKRAWVVEYTVYIS